MIHVFALVFMANAAIVLGQTTQAAPTATLNTQVSECLMAYNTLPQLCPLENVLDGVSVAPLPCDTTMDASAKTTTGLPTMGPPNLPTMGPPDLPTMGPPDLPTMGPQAQETTMGMPAMDAHTTMAAPGMHYHHHHGAFCNMSSPCGSLVEMLRTKCGKQDMDSRGISNHAVLQKMEGMHSVMTMLEKEHNCTRPSGPPPNGGLPNYPNGLGCAKISRQLAMQHKAIGCPKSWNPA